MTSGPRRLDSLGLVEALREQATVLGKRELMHPLPGQRRGAHSAARTARRRRGGRVPDRHRGADQRRPALECVGGRSAADRRSGSTQISVHDDGINLGAGWQAGVGLTSVRERAAELGGRCRIEHDRTGGRVDVELPIGAPVSRAPHDR